MNNFDTELKERTAYVEKIVYDYCPKEEGLQKIIIEAMNYSLKAGGKRLRPILTMEACKVVGGNVEDAIPYADDGNIPSVWWRDRSDLSVYGSNGNDSYIFISA